MIGLCKLGVGVGGGMLRVQDDSQQFHFNPLTFLPRILLTRSHHKHPLNIPLSPQYRTCSFKNAERKKFLILMC